MDEFLGTAFATIFVLICPTLISGVLLFLILRGMPERKLPLRGYWPPLQPVTPPLKYWINAILGLLVCGAFFVGGVYLLLQIAGIIDSPALQ